MPDITTHTNNSVPEQIYDTSALRHDVLRAIFPMPWASEYPGKPRLSRRERRNRDQRSNFAREVAKVFDADSRRRRNDHLAKAWRTAAEDAIAKQSAHSIGIADSANWAKESVKPAEAKLAAAHCRVAAKPLTHDDVRAIVSEEIGKVGDLLASPFGGRNLGSHLRRGGDGDLRSGIQEHDVDRVVPTVEIYDLAAFSRLDVDDSKVGVNHVGSVEVVVDAVNSDGVLGLERETHNSSPSVDDAGAHSVGEADAAGDASVAPAAEVTLEYLVGAVRDANLDIKSLRRIDAAALANYNESGRNLAKSIKDRTASERALLDYLTGDRA